MINENNNNINSPQFHSFNGVLFSLLNFQFCVCDSLRMDKKMPGSLYVQRVLMLRIFRGGARFQNIIFYFEFCQCENRQR